MSLRNKGVFISDGDTVRGRSTRNGSTGMFVQSKKFVEEHVGRIGDIAVYGQESNSTTRRLAIMNLAIRGIEGDLGTLYADTFRRDLHTDLKADSVLANPPFNDSDWHRSDEDVRWKYDVPPKGNANFAWVQHFMHDFPRIFEKRIHGRLLPR